MSDGDRPKSRIKQLSRGNDAKHVALCSGGMDSAVATHVTMQWGPGDLVVYLDTRTGLEMNREYVENLCDKYGWQLWTCRTNESYEQKVMENGFPGPSRHSIMYRSLKERSLQKIAAFSAKDVHFWTGVRRAESERRMGNVSPVQDHANGRWTWVAPIHDWTTDDCEEYLESFGVPRNDLWDTLGRSGDCFCGCFGSPAEKLDLRAAGCDSHAEWIESLESRVDTGDETETWAWGAMSDSEIRARRAELEDTQMTLCSSCGVDYPLPDGGEQR